MFGITIDGIDAIHEQLSKSIKKLVITGVLKKGSPLPSVRELALDLAINPNTVQKAYAFLEQQGITHSVSGKGRFVAVDASDLKKISQQEILNVTALQIKELKNLGMSLTDIKAEIEKIYEEGNK
ncbi:MAG: GntR family transcriptional regulator [Clostridia bacterium]|nr:GntR family transcriptional regulator [Clostridia bacterium]